MKKIDLHLACRWCCIFSLSGFLNLFFGCLSFCFTFLNAFLFQKDSFDKNYHVRLDLMYFDRFLSWNFNHVWKIAWLKRKGWFQNLWRSNLGSITKYIETWSNPVNIFKTFKRVQYTPILMPLPPTQRGL